MQRFKTPCHWYETGNPQDFLKATENCLEILTNKSETYEQSYLRRALERFSTETPIIESHGAATILRTASTSIENGVTIKGFGIFGASSKIQTGSVLENVVVANKIAIATNTMATDSIFLENN